MEDLDLSNLRNQYHKGELDVSSVHPDPFVQFAGWMQQAIDAGIDEPNAMALATSDANGQPSVRMVLLKGLDEQGFVFFTNYTSRKGNEISANSQVALVFFWRELERQVRIEGRAAVVSREESDDYFYSRPLESRASAVISPQSQVIPDRDALEGKLRALLSGDEKEITRPEHWGGYRVYPEMIEFWQGRPGRLHDRIRYTRHDRSWKIQRLAP